VAKWQEPKGATKQETAAVPPPAAAPLLVAEPVKAPARRDGAICVVTSAGTVRYSGKDYAPGELIELSEAEADRLVGLGVAEIA